LSFGVTNSDKLPLFLFVDFAVGIDIATSFAIGIKNNVAIFRGGV
jgi:hypothetical protein